MPRPNSALKILDSAATLFARHGFVGTIMDELAELAGVNKATIYYHFKDKEALYEKVLVDHLSSLVEGVLEAVETEQDVDDKLNAFIMGFATQNAKRPQMTSIMMREVAGGGDSMPDAAKAKMHQFLMILKSILVQGEEVGRYIHTDPMVIHFMIVGSLSLYITSEPMRKKMISSDVAVRDSFVNSTAQELATQLSTMVQTALIKQKDTV
jgi:AcrR family transcriptional regulator